MTTTRYTAKSLTATRWFVLDSQTDSVVSNRTDLTEAEAIALASDLNQATR